MKRDFLKNLDLGDGAKLPDAAIDAIMAEHGKTVNPLQDTINTLTGERDGAMIGTDAHAAGPFPKQQKDPKRIGK